MYQVSKKAAAVILATAMAAATLLPAGCAAKAGAEAAAKGVPENLYISFCVTNEKRDETFESHVYAYDLRSGKTSEKAVVPYNSGYPLAVYSAKDGLVYYSHKDSVRPDAEYSSPAQLYSYDPATRKSEPLTDNIDGINYIVPLGGRVLMVAWPIGGRDGLPFMYERGKGAALILGWDRDKEIRRLYADPKTGEVIGSAYSASENWKRIDEQTEEYPYEEPPASVYTVIGKDQAGTRRFDAHADEVVSLAQTSEGTICCTSSFRTAGIGMDAEEQSELDSTAYNRFMLVDKANGKRSAYKYGEKLGGLVDFVYVTDDSRYIFFIRYGKQGANELCRYDTSEDRTDVIYSAKSDYEEINNAIILAY
jgi:hypothetical protein